MMFGKGFPAKRLKWMADIRPSGVDKHRVEGEPEVRLCNYTDVYKNDRITDGMAFMVATASQEEIERFSLQPGDVIITKDSETPDDIAVPALVTEPLKNVVCGYHLALLRPKPSTVGAFLFWCLKAAEVNSQMSLAAQGVTRFGITTGALGRVLLPCPGEQDQRLIAGFLDRETAKLDALTAEQATCLRLLEEKRVATIARAVTRGLNAHAEMKDSGVEWLGLVPSHWAVCRLGYHARVENGSTPSRENSAFWTDGTIPWVSSGEVNQRVITEPSEYITQSAVEQQGLRIFPKDAVLVGLVGQGRTRGMAALMQISATINQNVAAVVTKETLLPKYLHYSLQAAYEFLRECGRGGNQAALNCEILSAFRIAVPPVEEQAEIVAHLDAVHASTMELAEQCRQGIRLLQERRAALISAAVTGKIDVRGLVPLEEAA